jgi:Co/Zn/Cd efflux system component
VFADTLRSIAVILAAILAELCPSITSEEADASAAVVVSVLIALSLVPLFSGMVTTIRSLQIVTALLEEETMETDEIEFEHQDD